MSGPEFFQTLMGKKYYSSQLPDNTKAMNRLAEALEKANNKANDQNDKLIYIIKSVSNLLEGHSTSENIDDLRISVDTAQACLESALECLEYKNGK
jgi:hypothetical protein